ncbi:hypothetical protein LMG28138_06104 [Pararobbsia alpina]|uniref:Uncharacterized protein n=1 Tax=Pararobbsia alpina TaxID=621374 RepID=A0A6S7BR42_9BURK|nr:hypothetical protein LMG28138_06104 [Pararobbsia alpina]
MPANRQVGHCMARYRIHHHHVLVRADGEETLVRSVNGESRRLLAGRQRPLRQHLSRAGIDLHDLTLVFHVDEDVTLTVGHKRLRFATHLRGRDNLARRNVNRAHALVVPVADVNTLQRRHIQNPVRIWSRGLNGVDHLQRIEVDDGNRIRTAVGHKAELTILHEREAVRAVGVFDLTEQLAGMRIDHLNVVIAAHEQVMTHRIVRHIVPALGALQRIAPGHFEVHVGLRGHRVRHATQRCGEKTACNQCLQNVASFHVEMTLVDFDNRIVSSKPG